MKGHKLFIIAIAAFIAAAAAVTAIVMFRDELTNFFLEMKGKLDSKRKTLFNHGDEFTDYADV